MRRIAFETVLRATGFATLAICCTMFGMAYDIRLSFLFGGTMTTVWTAILLYKAREARTKDYRKTEMWLCMPKRLRPPESYAQWASATVLRDTYLTVALWTSAMAIILWTIALLISVLGY